MYRNGWGVPQDYTEAMLWYRRAAEQGYASAQLGLAGMYASGHGVPQDYTEAMLWYRRAAEQGNVTGQFMLGMAYWIGEGVPQDYVEAHVWFNLSAAQEGSGAAGARDAVAEEMTREQLAEAQRRAREWFENNR